MDDRFAAGQGAAPVDTLDLQDRGVKFHSVVLVDGRSKCCEKTRSRSLRGQGRNAVPRCGAGTLNLRLNSATYCVARNALAASKVRTS